MAFLELHDAALSYSGKEMIVDGLNLAVENGELLSFLGPSGCGKTTTLRAIAGFVNLQRGRLTIAGRDYSRVPPNKRNIGMVFQSYALFPHLSVFDNVAFGLRLRRIPKERARHRVEEALRMVGLSGFDMRLPAQLSGGQQQRVAMARAIVIEPQLLLLDEPLSNLDAKLRVELRAELKRVQRRLGVTMIYVTHDQEEALALSDRVIVMNAGKIEQIGSPETIFQQPGTAFVARFMGFTNQITGVAYDVEQGYATVEAKNGRFVAKVASDVQRGDQVAVAIRPTAIQLASPEDASPPANHGFHSGGRVSIRTFKGDSVSYFVETPFGEIEAEVAAEHARWSDGDSIQVHVEKGRCLAYAVR